MIIRDMFEKGINRPINGVVKVDQADEEAIRQELGEYVITKELKRHFMSFFNYYDDAFDTPTADIGVWISGFFGSGKSHFLKMLSYLLENREVDGRSAVEYFRDKFENDPATFMLVDRAARAKAKTILFNIDIESSINKDKTAVLRVFAKMFYTYLGFYGENLKVAMLERYIEQSGKTEEFRRVFEEKKGKSWLEQRRAFAFNGKAIIPTLMEVMDMSEEDARTWFNDKTATDLSIALLVEDIKTYISDKPKDFRLVFMIDEVGQYVGTDTDMLLNLQSIVEKIGSECGGRVWVVCTGQEAIDEIIKVRADQFSRIQARFKTRLSLSSSSVDEVIQERILKKTPEAAKKLDSVYQDKNSELRNIFSFSEGTRSDIRNVKGYTGPEEFIRDYPFVPYQFLIMQEVFAEIRKHGNSGKHLSGGERSMLSGFQEAAKKIQEQDENSLVPFYRFYDTVHTFLDSGIRRVIERCQKAAENNYDLELQDVDVLKLLYLIRYITDIPATLDNIVILMADDIRMDKIEKRESVRASLDRLLAQNYIARSGDLYAFLTDEEQDIQRDIKNTDVDTVTVIDRVAQIIFGDIYASKKCRYGIYDFEFDKMVDGVTVGVLSGGMKLRFLSVAADISEKSDFHLMSSTGGEAAVVLAETPYYDLLERALKIRKFVKQRNVSQLPRTVQDIIRNHQDNATQYELEAAEALRKAIENAEFYADGEHLEIKGGDAKAKLDRALEYLVSHVYGELGLITKNAESEANIREILNGTTQEGVVGMEPNREAAAKVEEYLEMQSEMKRSTSMADVQSRYQAIPYGWREIDIAAVVAQLIYDQKVTIKYAGSTVQPDNPKLIDMLRKKSEIGKTIISRRESVSAASMKKARGILRDYFDVMDVPEDEDGLIRFIVDKFTERRAHYQELDARYAGHNYPDRSLVQQAIALTDDILSQQKDNTALIARLNSKETELGDSKDDMQRVESFFETQVKSFDEAVKFEEALYEDRDYIAEDKDAHNTLNQIRLIVKVSKDTTMIYRRIPELPGLMATVKRSHDEMLEKKRVAISEIVRQCMAEIHTAYDGHPEVKNISDAADNYYTQVKERIAATESLALLDGLIQPMSEYKDKAVDRIDRTLHPVEKPKKPELPDPGNDAVKRVEKTLYRQIVFPTWSFGSEEDIDAYLAEMKKRLMAQLEDCDWLRLS